MCSKQHDLRGDEETAFVSSLHQDDNVTNHGRLHAHLLTEPCEQVRAKSFFRPNQMEFSSMAFTSLAGSYYYCWLQQCQLCSCSYPPANRSTCLHSAARSQRHEAVVWQQGKVRQVVWSDESLGMQGCTKSDFSRSQKVKRGLWQHSAVWPTRKPILEIAVMTGKLTEVMDFRGPWKKKYIS